MNSSWQGWYIGQQCSTSTELDGEILSCITVCQLRCQHGSWYDGDVTRKNPEQIIDEIFSSFKYRECNYVRV